MTTVGYGDGFPTTILGRAAGVISCVIGSILVSLMVVSLSNVSEFTSEEAKVILFSLEIYSLQGFPCFQGYSFVK